MSGEAMRAGGADLAMVIDGGVVSRRGGADRSVLPEIRTNFMGNLMIEDVGPVGEHG